MKSIAIIFFTLISVALLAQQPTYTRIFSGPSYDEGIAAFRLPNKEIRLIGNTGSFGHGGTDVWLIALDSNGVFLWQKFYGGPNVEQVKSAVMTPQGDIFMVGSTTQNSYGSYQVYFLGLDQYGQIIAYNNYGGGDWDFGYDICQISDTTFALVGETYSSGAGQSDVYLLKVNRQGILRWKKTYGGLLEDRGNSIKLLPDGGFLIAGASKSFGNTTFDSYLLRLNSVGDTLWTNVLPRITDAEFLSVALDSDTSIVCSGYRKDTLDTYRESDLMKFNLNGTVIWSRYLSLIEGADCYATSLIVGDNKTLVYTGITTKFATSNFTNAKVSQLDSNGWYNNAKSIGDINEDIGNAVSVDNFHGKHYFLIGTTKSYDVSRSGVFFVRLDSNLNYDTTRIVTTPTSIISQNYSVEEIDIYPNPVKDILNVELPSVNENLYLSVINMTGKVVFQTVIESNSQHFEVPTQAFAAGVYHIRIYSQKRLFQSRFIKVAF